jgi:hypothetical protein
MPAGQGCRLYSGSNILLSQIGTRGEQIVHWSTLLETIELPKIHTDEPSMRCRAPVKVMFRQPYYKPARRSVLILGERSEPHQEALGLGFNDRSRVSIRCRLSYLGSVYLRSTT